MNIHVNQGPLPPDYPFATESRVLALLEIRKAASDEIERLIALMDELDGDPDLEPSLADTFPDAEDREGDQAETEELGDFGASVDDEPALGSTEAFSQALAWAAPVRGHDAGEPEDGHDQEDDRADAEPPLGWTDREARDSRYASTFGLESGEAEPSLGWTSSEAAFRRYSPVRDDREDDCEDEGAQCDDEGDLEQDTSGVDESWGWKKPEPGRNRWSLDPSLMPDRYFMTGDGNCLDPIIKDGDRVLIDRRAPIRPGDFVLIYLHRRFVPRGGHQVLMKRLVQDGRDGSATLADGRRCVLAEMLNPPRLLGFPAEAVLALHRLLRVDNTSPGYRVTQGEMLAQAAKDKRAAN